MLGMEIENMTIGRCLCVVDSACTLGNSCECKENCCKYVEMYKKIIDGGKYCYLTISPKVHELENDEDKLKQWLNDFADLKNCVSSLILVVEYTSKMILHFHMVAKIKDFIKFKKGFIQRWYFKANIEPIYGSQPKHGIHYLFKQSMELEKLLEQPAIYTLEELQKYCKVNPNIRRQLLYSVPSDGDYD